MAEADFQQFVVALARRNGFLVYHTYRSTRSEAGYPDLVMVRGRRMVIAELKRAGKGPSMAQVQWLLAMAQVPGVECYCWDETDTAMVEAVLA
jgi:hypothetical protein